MPPVLQALVLADHVYVDAGSGKKIIAGTFNRIWSSAFPASFSRSTWAFMTLTDFQGRIELELQFRQLATNQVLMRCPGIQVDQNDRLATLELIVEVPGFPMPQEGAYSLDVVFEQQILGSLRITCARGPTEGQP